MSTDRLRALEGFVLGESWVVTPNASEQKQPDDGRAEESPSESPSENHDHAPENRGRKKHHDPEPAIASSSAISGPELIMPSIHEAPVSEASWVAPELRPRMQSLHQRRRASRSRPGKSERRRSGNPAVESRETPGPSQGRQAEGAFLHTIGSSLAWGLEKIVRPGINAVLVAAIVHILVLPELVYQYQSLCGIAPVSDLYPTSCAPRYQQHMPGVSSAYLLPARVDSIITSQRRLEALFNATLQGIRPLSNSLKESESMLRDVQGDLKRVYPGVKHALDLEFQGCWQAIRTATQEFDSLKADMQSAADSLMATGSLQADLGPQNKRPSAPTHPSDAAKATRLSTQTVRREQYLERLSSRIRSKADSLCSSFATLDDHLESVEIIVDREEKDRQRNSPASRQFPLQDKLHSLFGSLLLPRGGGSAMNPPAENPASSTVVNPYQSVSKLLRDVANHHRPVMDLVQKLSRQLNRLQSKWKN